MKKWNSAYLIYNDNINSYSLTGTTSEGDSVTLLTDTAFRKIMLSKYNIFNMLPPGYFDHDENKWVELITTKAEAIAHFKSLFDLWMLDKKDGYIKLYEALRATYNPVNNYDKTIHEETSYEGEEINTNTPSGLESITNTKSGTEKHTVTPTGTETTTLTKSGTETVTETPTGTETTTLTKAGTETVTETPSGSESTTLTKTGTETSTETPTGSEQVTHQKGQTQDTTAKATFDSSTLLVTDQQTGSQHTDTDTTTFTNRETETELSFDQRQDASVTTYTNRKTETETAFDEREDTEVKSFDERQTEVETSFLNRQDTSATTFTNRKTEDELSFTNRQDSTIHSFTNRQTEDVRSFDERKDIRDYREWGNIGVTTSQQMITSQFPLTELDKLMHYIVNDFVHSNLVI